MKRPKRIILAVTGASGVPYALRLTEVLSSTPELQLHLIYSDAARKVVELETGFPPGHLTRMAHRTYTENEIAGSPASGSWKHDGMVVCPCSMKTLAAIATGLGSNLIHRAADVALKERRKLILVTRETPLNLIHLENMTKVTKAGGIIMPACPGFYTKATTLNEIVDFMVARVCDHLDVPHNLIQPWEG